MKPSPQAGRLLQSLGHKHVPHFPPRRNFVAIPSHRRAPKLYPARTQIPSQSHIPFKPFHPYLSILYAAVTFPYLEFTPNEPMRKSFFLDKNYVIFPQHKITCICNRNLKKATNCSARQQAISLGCTLLNRFMHPACTLLQKEP